MDIRFDGSVQPERDRYQAILITSANGLRALESTGSAGTYRNTPVVAVGPASAALAQNLGYTAVHQAAGDVASLAELVTDQYSPHAGALLYVTGSSRAGDLKADLQRKGFGVERIELYHAESLARLPEDVVREVSAADRPAVLLYSPRTARIWAGLVQQAGLSRRAPSFLHVCLSEAVAQQLRSSLQEALTIEVVDAPNDDAMIAALQKRKGGT